MLVDRGFVRGRISDADFVRVDGLVPVGIRNPSPSQSFSGFGRLPVSGHRFREVGQGARAPWSFDAALDDPGSFLSFAPLSSGSAYGWPAGPTEAP